MKTTLDKKTFSKEELNRGWGYSLHINLFKCDRFKITDKQYVTDYFYKICEEIKMTIYGVPYLVHFGKDPDVTGWSGFVFIEESNINFHLVENDNSAYIDIFSCKKFNIENAVAFTKEYFGAYGENHNFLIRNA